MCARVGALSHVQLLQPHGYSLPGSSVRGVFQARILEWVAISFSRGSAQRKDQTCVSCIVGELGSIPGLGRSPGEGKGYPLQYSGPGEFHGLYCPWGRKELDTTEQLHFTRFISKDSNQQ